MLKFKSHPKNILHIGILVDNSGSMGHISKETVNSLNSQILSLKEEARKSGIETYVSISLFNSVIEPFIKGYKIEDVGEIDASTYQTRGMTALRDAVGHMMDTVKSTQLGNMYFLLTITDGGENASIANHNIKQNIQDKIATDRWTFAFAGPGGSRKLIVNTFGVPDGCVTEWEQTTKGVETLTRSVLRSNTTLYSNYSAGATRSANYFTPDVNNLNPMVVQTNLDDVTTKFTSYPVKYDISIRDFVEQASSKPFRVGKNFYQLSKTEEVQDYKDIILQRKSDNHLFTGDGIRSLLRLPAGVTVKLTPTSSNEYNIFIRSTSWNRKLKPNTHVLVAK